MPETYTDRPLLGDASIARCCWRPSTTGASCARAPTIPYVAHLLGVTSLVLEMGGSETEAIGALLHDAVEDGGGQPMLERIRGEFGDDAARIVDANSDSDDRAQAAVVAAQARLHRRDRPQAARRAARLARRQAPQRPRDPARLPHPRRRALGPLQVRRGRLDPLVLPRALRGVRGPPRRARRARRARARGARPHGRRDRPAGRGAAAPREPFVTRLPGGGQAPPSSALDDSDLRGTTADAVPELAHAPTEAAARRRADASGRARATR